MKTLEIENVKTVSHYADESEVFTWEDSDFADSLSADQWETLSYLNDVEHLEFTVLNHEVVIVSDIGSVIEIFNTMEDFKRATMEEVNRIMKEDTAV